MNPGGAAIRCSRTDAASIKTQNGAPKTDLFGIVLRHS